MESVEMIRGCPAEPLSYVMLVVLREQPKVHCTPWSCVGRPVNASAR